MRLGLVVVLLVGCSSNAATCPSTFALYCSADQDGLTCDTELSGRPAGCTCDGRTWTCTDCPDRAPPTGTCSPGATCGVWGFENACACSCNANGAWSCSIDDPDPNFHCSY
jgi:hypothetical protein